jgi:hypothetical protein
MGAEKPTKFRERQFLIVDMNGELSVRAAVADNATEHVSAGNLLAARRMIFDLFLAGRLLNDRLVPLLQEAPLSVKDVVVHGDDVAVAHRGDLRTDRDPGPADIFFGVFEDRVALIAGDPHLVGHA